MANRLFRNGVPSSYPTLKTFPGTSVGPVYYVAYTLNSGAGATEWIITPTLEDTASFLSIYSVTFDSSSLTVNYLGDQGNSSTATGIFSVPVSPSTTYIIVANSIGTSGALGHSVTFDVDEQGSSTPEPATSALIGLGLMGLAAIYRRR